MKKLSENKGFIEIIVVVIIALVLLHVFGINLSTILHKQAVIDFFIYTRDLLRLVWVDLMQIINFGKQIAAQP